MKQSTKATVTAVSKAGATGDRGAKVLLSNKEIVAPLLYMLVPEFKGMSTLEVMRCIEGEISDEISVEDIDTSIKGEDKEFSSLFEKVITFDKYFSAVNPKHDDKRISLHLHIDLEMQKYYRPSNPEYPITMRGIYYGARALSRQLGPLTEKTDYSKLEKVYSIWICDNVETEMLQNTITSYSFTPKNVVGICKEPDAYHDLITLIVIRLGSIASKNRVFDYIDSIIRADIPRMQKYSDVEWPEELIKEADTMFTTEDYLEARYRETVINYIRNLMASTGWNAEEAMEKLQIPQEERAEISKRIQQ